MTACSKCGVQLARSEVRSGQPPVCQPCVTGIDRFQLKRKPRVVKPANLSREEAKRRVPGGRKRNESAPYRGGAPGLGKRG